MRDRDHMTSITGQSYKGPRLARPGAVFEIDSEGVLLIIELENIDDVEVLQGLLRFSLLPAGQSGLWFAIFDVGQGSNRLQFDCPFHAGLLPANRRTPREPGGYLAIPMVALTHDDGIVRHQRLFTISPHAMNVFTRAFNAQAAAPISRDEYMAAVEASWKRWPHAKKMLTAAVLTERVGLDMP